jgi:hypothetical protein
MPESNQEKSKQPDSIERLSVPNSPLIFISHDNRDAELAEIFSKLLGSVSAGVLKSFRSSDRKGTQGIEYGTEWYPELMGKLSTASDIVCLLTPRSLDRPWILYEAGVAKGKLNSSVYGIALGIPLNRANTGPFAQFQNCDDNEDSLTKLVIQLLSRVPNSEPDREAIQMQVTSFKGKADVILKKLGSTKDIKEDKSLSDETTVAKLFEEVKVMFQELSSRLELKISDAVDPIKRKKSKRLSPMMMDEMLHYSSKLGDPIGLLIILSYYRDDMPWLYEAGQEVYKAIKSGDALEAERAIMNFRNAIKLVNRAPMRPDHFFDSEDGYMMFKELPMLLERFLSCSFPTSKRQNDDNKK